jgi:transketolase
MDIRIAEKRNVDRETLGSVYVSKLAELAKTDERVVSLEADLMKAVGTQFRDSFPSRTFDCGIQEANMVGVAAGLSAAGMVPYLHSFGTFITRRAYDQIFITGAYSKLNLKLMGSDPGIAAAFNGGTHMPFEDMGLMRLIPGAIIIDITDKAMLSNVMEQIKDLYGIHYVRFPRAAVKNIYKMGSVFEIGKGIVLRHGSDATIIASGLLVSEALDAAEYLETMGIRARVVDMFTCKPVDKELVIECAKETGAIVTVENHNFLNGLSAAVGEVLLEENPVPMERIGSRDKFGEVGDVEYLKKAFEMTSFDIINQVKKVINRKVNKI